MIACISERQQGLGAATQFSTTLAAGGETTEVWSQPDVPEQWFGTPGELIIRDICSFQLWFQGHQGVSKVYGKGEDQMMERARQWWCHYFNWIEQAKRARKLTHILIWGSSFLGNRAAMHAAEALGMKVRCIEDGQFPLKGAPRTNIITPNRVYVERVPESLRDQVLWEEDYRPPRLEAYKKWWLQERVTKLGVLTKKRYNFPADTKRVVWFSQYDCDASQFWLTSPTDEAKLVMEGKAHKAFVKPHPLKDERYLPVAWPLIPSAVNVHEVLPHCDVVLVCTSGVGLEAWMCKRPVVVYGAPFFAHPGMVEFSLPKDHTSVKFDSELRNIFLDFYIHRFQCRLDQPGGYVERIKGAEYGA